MNNVRPFRVSCVAGILVGGGSRRMGQSKALLALPNGVTFVEHAVDVARRVADDVVLLGNFSPLPDSLRDLVHLRDEASDAGPLAGLCSLLRYAQTRWGLLLACDMPELSYGLLRRLGGYIQDDVDVVAYTRDSMADGYHACSAYYHPRILPAVQSGIISGRTRLQCLLEDVRVSAVAPSAIESKQLGNVNTPDDLARTFGVQYSE